MEWLQQFRCLPLIWTDFLLVGTMREKTLSGSQRCQATFEFEFEFTTGVSSSKEWDAVPNGRLKTDKWFLQRLPHTICCFAAQHWVAMPKNTWRRAARHDAINRIAEKSVRFAKWQEHVVSLRPFNLTNGIQSIWPIFLAKYLLLWAKWADIFHFISEPHK